MDRDSDDLSTDDGKRKTYPGREEEVFTRSKKIVRTPDKNKQKQENKIDEILIILKHLSQKVENIEKKQENILMELKTVKEENETIKKENEELKKEIKYIKEKMEHFENDKRRKNVVIQGLNIDTEDMNALKNEIESFIKQELDVEVDIKRGKKLGPKVCLIELNEMEDKIKIMRNKSKLRNNRNAKIFINDDLSKAERIIQSKIRNRMKEERKTGKNVKMRQQKLIIDGVIWNWNEQANDLIRQNQDTQKN